MPPQYCLICASDEGILLDIFSNNNFRDNIETCLSLKTKKSDLPSTKICHKCAYELDQCSKFVKKYKKTQVENGMLYKKHGYCSLCMEPGRKGLIFDLINENPLNNPQEKIHRLFHIDFVQGNFSNLSICLDCRYNLDVLFDLKCILTDHSDHLKKVLSGEIKSPNMEKIRTNVVRRKTTSVKSSPTKFTKDTLSDMDSDTSSISENTPRRLRSNGSSSFPYERQCEECHAKIPIGDDMFRYHTSGLTVCRQCWLKMDPSDSNHGKRRKISTETKLCCVFLKDIFTSSDNKPSTIEKDDNSDSIYTISDDSTMEESKPGPKKSKTISKSKRKNNQNDCKPLKKPKKDLNLKKSTRTRASSVQIEQIERKCLRSSRAKSVEVVRVVASRQLPEKKNSSETNKSKSQKKTNEVSKLNSSSEKINKKNISNATNRGRKRTRNKSNSSISSIEESRSSKTNKKMNKLSHRKVESDSENSRPYTCNICHNDFDNRVDGLTHELTHSKSLEVILKKVSITDNTENKLKNNETERNDEISDVINDVNNEKEVDPLDTELSEEPSADKSCNKDVENEIHNKTQTADNISKECENNKTSSSSENIETINDEKNDNNRNEDNDEKCNNNDSKQNNGSNSIKSISKDEEKADDNEKHEAKEDQNEQKDSLIAVDTSSDNGNISQEDHKKDNTDNHHFTSTDSNVDDSICEFKEKTDKNNENVDEKTSEKNTESTSDISYDNKNLVDPDKCEENEKKEETNKIESVINNMDENSHIKINDNNENDDSVKEGEKKDKKEKEQSEEEREQSEEKEEKSEGGKAHNEEVKEKSKEEKEISEGEKKNGQLEDIKESSQCFAYETINDSLANNKDETSLNDENVDDENENEEQLADKTVKNDKNCSNETLKKNISDNEDEGALIEQEMEKIRTHINDSKQIEQADLENIENSVELKIISNDDKSLSELNVTNSENGEEP
ncbi:LOW QUALITY PROTEIN: myb-like protein X [Chelonus insularis]|uniref:LOW QUALITY PROTEIN: myb-like protein X n=1 Tax=Chelonus insularis TaxID=460826 RepID=UPI00158C7E48|nr:LOW QUALITY PROTEIN: myb-like protein X [Chelonus insularis]